MTSKDYITMSISIISLLLSISSLIFTFLNFRRNGTNLKIEQVSICPTPFDVKCRPNRLCLDSKQSPHLWMSVPMLHLIVYIKIDNLSYTGVTISNFIINDQFLVSKVNTTQIGKKLTLVFFTSTKHKEQELEKYGFVDEISNTVLDVDSYDFINIGDRIEPKSSVEGIIVVSGNTPLYNAINDGINKLTIVTPDKKFDTYIEIAKTLIPKLENK